MTTVTLSALVRKKTLSICAASTPILQRAAMPNREKLAAEDFFTLD